MANLLLPWPNDGRLGVDSTRIGNMRDHTLVTATHDHLTFHPLAIGQILHFLKHGQFWRLMSASGQSEPAIPACRTSIPDHVGA